MPENEANKANYDEIRGHLDIIKAKLAKPVDRDGRESLLESQEDYYERMLQLRIMQNQTQAEELKETTSRAKSLERRTNRFRLVAYSAAVAVGVMGAEILAPGIWWFFVTTPFAKMVLSHVAVAIVVLGIAAMLWR